MEASQLHAAFELGVQKFDASRYGTFHRTEVDHVLTLGQNRFVQRLLEGGVGEFTASRRVEEILQPLRRTHTGDFYKSEVDGLVNWMLPVDVLRTLTADVNVATPVPTHDPAAPFEPAYLEEVFTIWQIPLPPVTAPSWLPAATLLLTQQTSTGPTVTMIATTVNTFLQNGVTDEAQAYQLVQLLVRQAREWNVRCGFQRLALLGEEVVAPDCLLFWLPVNASITLQYQAGTSVATLTSVPRGTRQLQRLLRPLPSETTWQIGREIRPGTDESRHPFARSKANSPTVSRLFGGMVVDVPPNSVVVTLRLTYYCVPPPISLDLNQTSVLPEWVHQHIVDEAVAYTQLAVQSPTAIAAAQDAARNS